MGSARGRACVFAVVRSVVICALAAGATWTNPTSSAPWAARAGHTSVIDAAGAIYVIGGYDGGINYRDVWVSTGGGARPDSERVLQGVLKGYSGRTRRYHGVLSGSIQVLQGKKGDTKGALRGYCMGTTWYSRGTEEVKQGYSRGTQGVLRGV